MFKLCITNNNFELDFLNDFEIDNESIFNAANLITYGWKKRLFQQLN